MNYRRNWQRKAQNTAQRAAAAKNLLKSKLKFLQNQRQRNMEEHVLLNRIKFLLTRLSDRRQLSDADRRSQLSTLL